ncbi:MAG TPA: CopG family transcriptional regulator [Gammaproteobacteria bacterium]|nr:CopG family transcriptional regulator [Gammaproteobacteria bacterium]HKV97736.1 CopG family transcriptional regulator [Gammaproteobacteria bacterium]
MSRITISITNERHKALKAAAARRGKTIGELVAEGLEAVGIKPENRVAELLAKARARSRLSAAAAEKLAVEETRKARQ